MSSLTAAVIWKWFKEFWWVALALALAALGIYIDRKARKEENLKRDVEAANVTTEVVSQITENTDALVKQSDAVRSHTAVVELPDGTQGLPEYHYRD